MHIRYCYLDIFVLFYCLISINGKQNKNIQHLNEYMMSLIKKGNYNSDSVYKRGKEKLCWNAQGLLSVNANLVLRVFFCSNFLFIRSSHEDTLLYYNSHNKCHGHNYSHITTFSPVSHTTEITL